MNKDSYQLSYSLSHDIGKVRPVNEDAIFAFSAEIMKANAVTQLGLFIIADGMGGHSNGEKASAIAVSKFSEDFYRTVYPKIIREENLPADLNEDLTAILGRTNEVIHREYPGSGTTFSCLLIVGNQFRILHIGDSRIYYLPAIGEASVLTKDHSLVQLMIDLGEITEDEAKNHARRNVILKSLGFEANVEADLIEGEFEPGVRFLLCCDGVWSVVSDEIRGEILSSADSIAVQTERLTAAANDAGGPDNISCILVKTEESAKP